MDKYYNIATKFIKEAGDNYAIVKESIKDLDDYYCFTYHTTPAMPDGPGYNFINKKDDRIFSYESGVLFASALKDLVEQLTIEARIKVHKADFNIKTRFDILIVGIKNENLLTNTLIKHATYYVVPEIVGDSITRTEKNYYSEVLEERLKYLPTIFRGIKLENGPYLIDELIKTESCEFNLLKHIERQYAKDTKESTNKDLAPVW